MRVMELRQVQLFGNLVIVLPVAAHSQEEELVYAEVMGQHIRKPLHQHLRCYIVAVQQVQPGFSVPSDLFRYPFYIFGHMLFRDEQGSGEVRCLKIVQQQIERGSVLQHGFIGSEVHTQYLEPQFPRQQESFLGGR